MEMTNRRVASIARIVVTRGLPLLVLLCSIAMIAYYVISASHGTYNADVTDTILWAEASYVGRTPLNTEFFYACTLPFGGHLTMLPFMPFFGVSFATHAAGMILFGVILAVALYWGGLRIGCSRLASALMTAMILAVASSGDKLREVFWGHTIYYSLGVLFLIVGFTLIHGVLRREERIEREIEAGRPSRSTVVLYLLVFAWFLLCGTNRLQAFVVFALPLTFGFVAERLLDFSRAPLLRSQRSFWLAVLAASLGTVAGLALGAWLGAGIDTAYSDGYSTFTASRNWIDNFMRVPVHWLYLLGASPAAGTMFVSGEGLRQIICIAGALILAAAPVILLLMYPRIQDRATRVWLLTHWCLTALILFPYVFGRFGKVNWRLSPLVFTSALLTFLLLKRLWETANLRRFAVLALCILLPFCLFSGQGLLRGSPGDYRKEIHYRVAEYLQRHHLTYGYATFWNASVVTVQSASRVKVRPVELKGKVTPRYYQSNRHWYDKQAGVKRYFLLLDDKEYGQFIRTNRAQYAQRKQDLSFAGFHVIVYDFNIGNA